MSRPARMLFPATQRRTEALGARLRAARLRRRMSETEMAERAFVSRTTLRKLEAGDMSVSAAVLARVLEILALDEDLDRIASDDELGNRLADARTPLPHRRRGVA
ncbi:MAG: helix-turn-helix transcriptional regulator [Chloroflexi bacterium]|nr:helix-turn-helix transcriptional regulator [Chloroflexota bacterium]